MAMTPPPPTHTHLPKIATTKLGLKSIILVKNFKIIRVHWILKSCKTLMIGNNFAIICSFSTFICFHLERSFILFSKMHFVNKRTIAA